jgi:hypothetical protein
MKFTTDFTTVNGFIKAMIEEEIKASLNAIPVLICKYSNHPDDDYLYLYVARKGNGTYITGLANTSRSCSVGLYENHYDCTFEYAMQVIADKIHDFNKEA